MIKLKGNRTDLKGSHLSKMLSLFSFFILLFIPYGCQNNVQQDNDTEKPKVVKEKWHWDNPDKQSENSGYAQVVKVGNTIYVSGVPAKEITPEGIRRLYKGLEESLNAFGATPKDVVKETLYTTDMESMKKHNNVRKEFYQGDYPAASWVQISGLYQSDAKLEVDLIAVITDSE